LLDRDKTPGSAGDFPFGYESYYLDSNWQEQLARRGPKPRKGIRIKEEEAKSVRQILEWFVALWSIAAIARELNRLGIRNPGTESKKGWNHQHLRRLLSNAKYVGSWTWGATTTIRNSAGKKKQIAVPADEIVIRERPELRIIDQETWDKAQKRLRELEYIFGLKEGQKPLGPKLHPTDIYPQSLLGGLIYCGMCTTSEADGATRPTRLWQSGTGNRHHLYCPNHKKGLCSMNSLVYVEPAEGNAQTRMYNNPAMRFVAQAAVDYARGVALLAWRALISLEDGVDERLVRIEDRRERLPFRVRLRFRLADNLANLALGMVKRAGKHH
jgi:hypothetical protein